jgi:hypothetical protein
MGVHRNRNRLFSGINMAAAHIRLTPTVISIVNRKV